MTPATGPARVLGAVWLAALGLGVAATCGSPRPPASVAPTVEPVGGLSISRALLPVVIGWPATMAPRTPTPTRAPRPTAGPRDALIARVVGFARLRGVDGAGLRGVPCEVRSLEWRGADTLAACLERPGRWITFAVRGRLTMRGDLAVPSNTTIDAREAGVQLWGGGLVLSRAENVIIAGLAITECDDDAIKVTEHSAGVYLDGLDLSRCHDGLVDITDNATDVTLAHSTLRDHAKAMLIGASDGHASDSVIRVTIHDTIFATTYRHPMCRYGYVHLDRATFGPWVGDAVDARFGCRVLITRSWFVPGAHGLRATARFVVPSAPGAVRIDAATDLGRAAAEVGGEVAEPPYGRLP